jgi:DNA modification methylase
MKDAMKTTHRLVVGDSRQMNEIGDESIDLVVTSPPYPMIEMWDGVFATLSPESADALKKGDGNSAFEAMHCELDKVWRELHRVMKPGAFACINVGDATRSIAGRFRLYSNHSRIISAFRACGFDSLPVLLWRKQTNAPNKFMGSGMLPAGAYVTLEHEYILVFRKGAKREFVTDAEKSARMGSAFFWEERNRWFSDVWDFKGTVQSLNHDDLRSRSGAYPLELPYRLVNMYSLCGDTVLDPFLGTGTTTIASIACGRNSVGIEIDRAFSSLIVSQAHSYGGVANQLLSSRITDHSQFISTHTTAKGPTKHVNGPHGFPVVTLQETGMELYRVLDIVGSADLSIEVVYEHVGRLDNAADVARETRLIRNAGTGQLTLDL